jgi:Spy/CpxP family protein refolding chaperone
MTSRSVLPCAVLLLAAMLPGQTPQGTPPSPPPARGPRGGFGLGPLSERRLTSQLGLSAEQQNKVHTVIAEGSVQQQGLVTKEREIRTRLATAVKAGNEAQIDSVTQELSQVSQQRTAIHAKTVSRVYGALTADQKAKVEPELSRSLGVGGPGGPGFGGPGPRGPRRGGPGGPPPAASQTPAQQ